MTADVPPGTAGFAVPSYQRATGVHPPLGSPGYRSSLLRAPKYWPVPLPQRLTGGTEAPHLDVSVFARGLLDRVVTRIYFADEAAANAADPVLSTLGDPERVATLPAVADPGGHPGEFSFDIRLQGGRETVFFDV